MVNSIFSSPTMFSTLLKINLFGKELILYHTTPTFNNPEKKPFENIVGKGENGGYQLFLLFPQCFLPFSKRISILCYIYFVGRKCFRFGPVWKFVIW